MRLCPRGAASDDVVRQFRYYLVTLGRPDVALRFRASVRSTIQTLKKNPYLGAHYAVRNPQLPELRCWPVADFEQFGIYYTVGDDTVSLIRILHGRRNIRRILESERL